jgi:hypothetical protein
MKENLLHIFLSLNQHSGSRNTINKFQQPNRHQIQHFVYLWDQSHKIEKSVPKSVLYADFYVLVQRLQSLVHENRIVCEKG